VVLVASEAISNGVEHGYRVPADRFGQTPVVELVG